MALLRDIGDENAADAEVVFLLARVELCPQRLIEFLIPWILVSAVRI